MTGDAQRMDIRKAVWMLLESKYPVLSSFNGIWNDVTIQNALPSDRCEDQRMRDLTKALKGLEDLGLVQLPNRLHGLRAVQSARARYDETALNKAVEDRFITATEKQDFTDREQVRKKALARYLEGDFQYVVATMNLYQSKANSFASLFVATLFGLYALVAMIPALRAAHLHLSIVIDSRLEPYPLLTLGLTYSIILALVSLMTLSVLIGVQYFKYTRMADEVNHVLYADDGDRQAFLQNTAVLDWLSVRRAVYVCIMAIFLLTSGIMAMLFLWWP